MSENRDFRRVLITGIGGSGGSYLAEHILNNHADVEVHGIARWHSTTQNNLDHLANKIQLHEADLLDFGSTFLAIKNANPDAIFHLAAHANVRASFDTPASVLNNNILGTSNLLEVVRLMDIKPWIQLCSTSEVYGQVDPKYVPIHEEVPMRPASPYAVSKTAQDLLGWTYYTSYQMQIIRTRMFSYLNPRRVDLFATSFARQVARIEFGLQETLMHGNLDSVRTLIDVRDAMRAYWEALIFCQPGEAYNIGGTTTMKVGEFLDVLKGLASKTIPTSVDPKLLRPADVTLQIPDVSKFHQATKWEPKYSFEESLHHLLDYWRVQIGREVSKSQSSD